MYSDLAYVALFVLLSLNIIFAAIVFFERKNPAVTWAWLMVSVLLPYIGFIIYLCLGMEGKKHEAFIKKYREDSRLLTRLYDLDAPLPGACSSGNQIEIFHDGEAKFKSLISCIKEAKSFIHMEYYIIRKGVLAQEVLSALTEKAEEGVEVKLLMDGMGSLWTDKKLFAPLIKAGGETGVFTAADFMRINYRNHRKIAVIDGKWGYIGGLNIGDEYVGRSKRFGKWRDCHIQVKGPAAQSLEARFIMDWNYGSGRAIEAGAKYFPAADSVEGGVDMRILSSGPDARWPSIYDAVIKMITGAGKSIFIQTPYFVPDETMFSCLRIAALSGVDVRIMIPANPDHPFVYWAALSYIGELIEAGVKCYQYEKGFLHSKVVLADSHTATVGTANLDIRSFRLNFEVNAFIYDSEKTLLLEERFLEDIKDCTVIDKKFYTSLSLDKKIKEAVSRLLSPLL